MGKKVLRERYERISPSEFFYRYRDLAGFSNPSRALFSTVRELVENALDACDTYKIPPTIFIRVERVKEGEREGIYRVRVVDNGIGVPKKRLAEAFGSVLISSKYQLRQTRGMFGLGGTMAILYAQITTGSPAHVFSSQGGDKIFHIWVRIDIEQNTPVVENTDATENPQRWRGLGIEVVTKGWYRGAAYRILEYLRRTAIILPYATMTYVDPDGWVYHFPRTTSMLPEAPRVTKQHPSGVDLETLRRLVKRYRRFKRYTLLRFLKTAFSRVGDRTARELLDYAQFRTGNPKLAPTTPLRSLTNEDLRQLYEVLSTYPRFLPPDGRCLSPIGPQLLEEGVKRMLKPDYVHAVQRRPSSCEGHPFIVEVALAYGGAIPSEGVRILRFANKMPLLYDEGADVVWKVVSERINWRRYGIDPDADPIVVVTHICSTRIPYRSVGKEAVADRPEIERELVLATQEAARRLKSDLERRRRYERYRARLSLFERYLPKIAMYSAALADREVPSINVLLAKLQRGVREQKKETGT
ncbi:DNA topoisomerase VI subunit B [archaeon]|nr:DNA topoisomerase VI subunit B [archaeon]